MIPGRRAASIILGALVLATSAFAQPYVEQSLRGAERAKSVIVTASSAAEAAAAVRRVGGTISSELPIVNAVAATVSARGLARLGNDRSVVSVIDNKQVKPAEWNGWVTDQRVFRGFYQMSTNIDAGAAHLADGGFAAVSASGELIVVNADGSTRRRSALPNGTYRNAPLATTDSIYIVGSNTTYALDPRTGTQRWQAARGGTGTVDDAGNAVVLDSAGSIAAISPANMTLWQYSLASRGRVAFPFAPVAGTGGVVYAVNDAGDLYAVGAAGIRWTANLGTAAQSSPVVKDGVVYVGAGSSLYAFDAATGAQRFRFAGASAGVAPPLVSNGTALWTTASHLYSINVTTGTARFGIAAPGGNHYAWRFQPLMSPDGVSIYGVSATTRGRATSLFVALNPATGAQRWSYTVDGDLSNPPDVAPDGRIFLTDTKTSLYFLDQNGVETDRLKIHAEITGISRSSETGNVILRVETTYLVFLGRLPDQWNGRPDVERTDNRNVFRTANPVAVDVGADVLHRSYASGSGGAYVRGGDVVVAVLDSGVYWDEETKQVLGVQLQHQFLGQADFIQRTCTSTGGVQHADHCFNNYFSSRDGYGHGTHVAGSISMKLTDEATGSFLGVAPDARILSVRALGDDGTGTYESVIKGIQYVVQNKATFNIRVLNLSLSAYATVPYFVDPLNRAVERAWQAGIVVVAAAGNTGPFAGSITVPGNDPYVITVGAVSSNRTPGYWRDDVVPLWSATGPTHDGFAKPDIVAPGAQIISYMYNDPTGVNRPALVRLHPDYSANAILFRMNGTSMATGIASGVVALMLQVNPTLTPDQVKYRLLDTARMSIDRQGEPVFNTLQQGLGRIWAPDAVRGASDPNGFANLGMNLADDLSRGYETLEDLSFHYQGPIRKMVSDDGTAILYYATDSNGTDWGFGATTLDGRWLDVNTVARMTWSGARMTWSGGLSFSGDHAAFGSARMTWSGSRMTWSGARMTWSGARMTWSGARMTWSGGMNWNGGAAWGSARMTWSGNADTYAVARMTWSGSLGTPSASNARWIDDAFIPPAAPTVPPPAATQP